MQSEAKQSEAQNVGFGAFWDLQTVLKTCRLLRFKDTGQGEPGHTRDRLLRYSQARRASQSVSYPLTTLLTPVLQLQQNNTSKRAYTGVSGDSDPSGPCRSLLNKE